MSGEFSDGGMSVDLMGNNRGAKAMSGGRLVYYKLSQLS